MSYALFVVVPCFNEEDVLQETSSRLAVKMAMLFESGRINYKSRVLFVDDGSSDSTWSFIKSLNRGSDLFCGISLSHNRGHQSALYAGLMTAREYADAVISMDADLQDDIDVIDRMLDEYENGAEIVYGVRSSRKKDSFFKRFTAGAYYTFLKLMGCDIKKNHADFRLMSAKALGDLSEYKEHDLFLRGIVPMLGYKTAEVRYQRTERFAGKSKYSVKKMTGLAVSGILSLSLKPIHLILVFGIFALVISLILFLIAIIRLCFGFGLFDPSVTNFSIWFIGGLVLTAIGINAEYTGHTYLEAKDRPRYNISESAGL